MIKKTKLLLAGCASLSTSTSLMSAAETQNPNIIYILADDLGYGDISCLNPKGGLIPTPNIDGMAKGGMTFTDAHTSSSVCTPSRYSLVTGRYNWRSIKKNGVLNGYSNHLIEAGRLTIASMLQSRGY